MTASPNQIALVTGASRGIGKAIALDLAAGGTTLVAVHYNGNRDLALQTVAEIESHGAQAFAISANLATVGGVDRLLAGLDEHLQQRTGQTRFDILVNNAGIVRKPQFESTTEDDFDAIFNINVKSLFFLTQKALPRLRDGGRIINVSSAVTRGVFSPDLAAYAASKGAVDMLTMYLAPIAGRRNITVNSVNPGAIDTDMNADWLRTAEGRQAITESAAIARVGEASDIAGIVGFLASRQSGWMTGQRLDGSGGWRL